MKTLALRDGDLVVGQTGHGTVTGATKIGIEIQLALAEPFGDDRFHPGWGSLLDSYLGRPIDQVDLLVEAEMTRVLKNYISVQQAEVLKDALGNQRSRYSTSDVVQRIISVDTHIVLDSIRVKLLLSTQSGEVITISKQVNL